MTPLQVTRQAQAMDKTQEDSGSEGSVAPGEPAGLQCPGATWMAADQPGLEALGHPPARTFSHHKKRS